MESVVYDDSPLAKVLLEGNRDIAHPVLSRIRCEDGRKICDANGTKGEGEFDSNDQQPHREEDATEQPAFAPRSLGLRERLKQRLGRPLKIAVPEKGPVAKIQDVCTVRYKWATQSTRIAPCN
jgi:hypothetical protein